MLMLMRYATVERGADMIRCRERERRGAYFARVARYSRSVAPLRATPLLIAAAAASATPMMIHYATADYFTPLMFRAC